jgi:hypothetical protein
MLACRLRINGAACFRSLRDCSLCFQRSRQSITPRGSQLSTTTSAVCPYGLSNTTRAISSKDSVHGLFFWCFTSQPKPHFSRGFSHRFGDLQVAATGHRVREQSVIRFFGSRGLHPVVGLAQTNSRRSRASGEVLWSFPKPRLLYIPGYSVQRISVVRNLGKKWCLIAPPSRPSMCRKVPHPIQASVLQPTSDLSWVTSNHRSAQTRPSEKGEHSSFEDHG